nr:fibrobacter succinogenes major paralogous domain-containing protein [Candidatus Neomarinimicrobiota bacterium]
MKRNLFFLIISCTFVYTQTAEITNITASQRTDGSRLVDVCYDLQGDENFAVFSISAEISFDGGSSYQLITMANGHIGGDIEQGSSKCFVWDFGNEVGATYTANAIFRLTADSAPMAGSCVDYDGNEYETIEIGSQLWMSESLKTTHYNNGDVIPTNLSNSSWQNTNSGAVAVYSDQESNADMYGRLYNWYAVDDNRGVCPENFHVPTDEEYKELEMYLGMSESEANST